MRYKLRTFAALKKLFRTTGVVKSGKRYNAMDAGRPWPHRFTHRITHGVTQSFTHGFTHGLAHGFAHDSHMASHRGSRARPQMGSHTVCCKVHTTARSRSSTAATNHLTHSKTKPQPALIAQDLPTDLRFINKRRNSVGYRPRGHRDMRNAVQFRARDGSLAKRFRRVHLECVSDCGTPNTVVVE